VRRRRRSLLWSLVRFSFVMAFFGALGLTAVFGYIWFTLNQQGLLKIPERDPGIIILASDGSVLAEKGSFNGDEVRAGGTAGLCAQCRDRHRGSPLLQPHGRGSR
jgi:penicillin-binding protein 1A